MYDGRISHMPDPRQRSRLGPGAGRLAQTAAPERNTRDEGAQSAPGDRPDTQHRLHGLSLELARLASMQLARSTSVDAGIG